MNGIKRAYYPLPMAADKMGCSVDDLLHLGATNRLEICAYVSGVTESNDHCTFNVFIGNDKYHDEIENNNSIQHDFFIIALFNYNDKLFFDDDHNPKFESIYGNMLQGFFALNSESLVAVELSRYDDGMNININELTTPKVFGEPIKIANIDGLSVSEDKLVVLGSELEAFSPTTVAKYPGSEKETPKTIAKKSQLIPALLGLIPEFNGLDLSNTPVAKIIDIVETLASKKGVELPRTDKNTWSKYLGRK